VGKLLILLLLAVCVAAVLVPMLFFARNRGGGQVGACASNLKNIATALEMYSTDNKGAYPTALAALTPNYLKFSPNCPSANQDTYSATYEVRTAPDNFTLACQGHHHQGSKYPADYPQYSSQTGLIVP
jgi:hypothetical protein